MNRREFVCLSAGAITMSALSAWESVSQAADTQATRAHEMSAAEFHSARKFALTDQGRIAYIDKGNGPAALFLRTYAQHLNHWGTAEGMNPLGPLEIL